MSRLMFFLILCLFSTCSFATSSMEDRQVFGYFTNDDHLDELICDSGYLNRDLNTFDYSCTFILEKTSMQWIIQNNNECGSFSIDPGSKKGEVITECGTYGQMTTSYYQFDDLLNNWTLFQSITEFFPVYGDLPVEDTLIIYPKIKQTIDGKIINN